MSLNKNQFEDLRTFLNEKVDEYNRPEFIPSDPISIPHLFTKTQDIEIAGFFAATFSWGQRKTIINKSKELLNLMDNAPHDFIINHKETDLKPFLDFKHRTFNQTDTLYFIHILQKFYSKYKSLENAFLIKNRPFSMKEALSQFHELFFDDIVAPSRTRKHVSTPTRNSACKRLNMFLRWMVRNDRRGVDFGIWKNIKSSDLICPCDVHVDRIARQYGLIERKQTDWQTAEQLTQNLKLLDHDDPVKYDFALFGLGVMEKDQFPPP